MEKTNIQKTKAKMIMLNSERRNNVKYKETAITLIRFRFINNIVNKK